MSIAIGWQPNWFISFQSYIKYINAPVRIKYLSIHSFLPRNSVIFAHKKGALTKNRFGELEKLNPKCCSRLAFMALSKRAPKEIIDLRLRMCPHCDCESSTTRKWSSINQPILLETWKSKYFSCEFIPFPFSFSFQDQRRFLVPWIIVMLLHLLLEIVHFIYLLVLETVSEVNQNFNMLHKTDVLKYFLDFFLHTIF